MPKCKCCGEPVINGVVLHSECYERIKKDSDDLKNANALIFGAVELSVKYSPETTCGRLKEILLAEASNRLLVLPCKEGETVYRICPKCNSAHDGSCDNCAWQGTGGANGCTVFGLWDDGSYDARHCTIVPWKATYHRMPTIIAKLGTRIFLSREEAERALEAVSG